MNFTESNAYLLSLGNEVDAMKLGLENIGTLLTALGKPQEKYLKVQVAGTNGKGSVCAFLDSICNNAGIRTGTFTSPHLISITERIRINGEDITEDAFARHAGVREVAESLLVEGSLEYRPTFFEQITAISLLAFAEASVQLAILETGLGGRLDATTAANAEIAVITPISLDHQEYLGNTIREIAAEKAAIINQGTRAVVVAAQLSEADKVIEERIDRLGKLAFRTSLVVAETRTGSVEFRSAKGRYQISELGLKGRHQVENAKAAILAAEELQLELAITPKNIEYGLMNARHHGRLESRGKYLFDGAHNVAGAIALRAYLDEFVRAPLTIIFGAMRGKDITEIGEILFPKADLLILTRPSNTRALAPEDMRATALSYPPKSLVMADSVSDALAAADKATPVGGIILITGSLYLVGDARRLLTA